MAFEAIVQRVTFTGMSGILECAFEQHKYPWELPAHQQPREWRQSKLRALLEPCLARNAAARPSAASLCVDIGRLGHATTYGV
jgi:hypothetical protein